jgi:pentapeptide MXKDX repeat protein
MRKVWLSIAGAVVCLGLGLAVVGWGSWTGAGNHNMQGDNMQGGNMQGGNMQGDDMQGGNMQGGNMQADRMSGDNMGGKAKAKM